MEPANRRLVYADIALIRGVDLVLAQEIPNSTRVLLGAIPMEAMNILIDSKRERLMVNLSSREMARMLLM